jgi:hypothetical protein
VTRAQFIARAIRAAEREFRIPRGWWGTWRDVTNGKVRVHLVRGWCWRVTRRGVLVSDHDSRPSAIGKAAKL